MTTSRSNFILVLLLACAQMVLASVSMAAAVPMADAASPGIPIDRCDTVTTPNHEYGVPTAISPVGDGHCVVALADFAYDEPAIEPAPPVNYDYSPASVAGRHSSVPQLLPRPPPSERLRRFSILVLPQGI